MTPERWVQVERLFYAALECPPAARAAFLDDSCRGDEDLRREVKSLLDSSAEFADDLLERQVLDVAARLIDLPSRQPRAGQQLGDFELRASLGMGGMGEVYRARDLKLGRDVAIKLLPELLADDADRVSRFRREAQILATLNHPHIAAIYALVEDRGVVGLVLELVEGPTLAERLATGPVSIDEALRLACQAAAALEAAHARGIVHRDLKPANIKTTADGTLKVLDFGLAKAIGREPIAGATAMPTVEATHEGVILGTVAYMSPEQARGLPVDTRTDIWAFGCVVYELLTGHKAFSGATAADYIAAIVHEAPAWSDLPPATPAAVVDLLKRCLEKDAALRPNITDVSYTLNQAVAERSRGIDRSPSRATRRRPSRLVWVTSAAAAAGATLLGGWWWQRPDTEPRQSTIRLPADDVIVPSHSSDVAVSPDGTVVAYASTKSMTPMAGMALPGPDGQAGGMASMPTMTMAEQIYVRHRESEAARPLGGARGGAPVLSPDGRWLGFWHAPTGTVRRVALTGGAPVRIAAAVSGIAGAAWGPDDTIVYAWFDLFRVPAAGGEPSLLLKVDEQRGERFYRHPAFLPSGRALLFTIGAADSYSYDDAQIGVLSLETGQKKILVEGGSSARYSPSGHLIYAREGKLLAVAFDPDRLEITGEPFTVVDGVFMSGNTGMAAYDISRAGDLVYAAGPAEQGRRVPAWVDRQGRETRIPLPARAYLHPRLSPDGRQIALEVEGASHDIFVYEIARGVLTKMSFDGASHWPMFTPTGRDLTFRSWKTGGMTMWAMPADRSRPASLLTDIGTMQSPESWSPDGRVLAFTQMDKPESGSDVYALPTGGDRKPFPVLATKFSEGSPKFSPDGRWLAYASDESGQPEIYAIAYPGPGPKIQISTKGGTDPVWRRDGRELFYRNGRQMLAVDIRLGRTLQVSKPVVLWEGSYLAGVGSSCGMPGPTSANYDVTADGQRFLMIVDTGETAECRSLQVVSNWARTVRPAAR
jgi:serine/threonine protein kinase/Tol biopolymer transport system component